MLGPLLAALALQVPPPPPPVTAGDDRWSAVRIQLSGHLDTHYAYRGATINEAADVLNGVVPPGTSSSNFWSGRAGLRADITVREKAAGVLELETRSFDTGENIPKGLKDEAGEVFVEQAYLELPEFISSRLTLRAGVQHVAFRNRPQSDPFFMELGESEGFFEGLGTSGTFIRNTSDRDVREAAGLRARWDFHEVISAHALALVYGEPPGGGPTGDDESVYALVLNGTPMETLSTWLLAALVTGDGDDRDLWTGGAGIDWFPVAAKTLELFGEAYLQGGTLADDLTDVSKRAWAGEAGARVAGDRWAAEASFAYRSGDPHPSDRRDRAFQSYENVNRFLILEDAEFGLDIDTNYRSFRAAVEAGPIDLGGAVRHLRVRVDAGHFRLDDPARSATGSVIVPSGDDDLGVEADATVRWAYTESVSLWLRAAWLAGSDALEALAGKDDTAAAVAGGDLRF